MKLNEKEREILRNQYLILKALYPNDADYYDEKVIILEQGFELEYGDGQHIDENTLSYEECDDVLCILNMFDHLSLSYDRLSSEDKAGIDYPRSILFRGFDGNEEGNELAYVNFYLKKRGRYQNLKWYRDGEASNANEPHASLNSHYPLLDRYKAMLEEYRSWKNRVGSWGDKCLLKEDILQIIKHY